MFSCCSARRFQVSIERDCVLERQEGAAQRRGSPPLFQYPRFNQVLFCSVLGQEHKARVNYSIIPIDDAPAGEWASVFASLKFQPFKFQRLIKGVHRKAMASEVTFEISKFSSPEHERVSYCPGKAIRDPWGEKSILRGCRLLHCSLFSRGITHLM